MLTITFKKGLPVVKLYKSTRAKLDASLGICRNMATNCPSLVSQALDCERAIRELLEAVDQQEQAQPENPGEPTKAGDDHNADVAQAAVVD